MEPIVEREEATTSSQLVGILPGESPKINLVDFAADRCGRKRHFAQQVSVPDPDLFARLQSEARVGDHIHATIVNEYREMGSTVYLADFQKMNDSGVIGVKNGTHDVSQVPIPTSTITTASQAKTKAHH